MYICLVLLMTFLICIDQLTKKIMYDISGGVIGYSIPIIGDFLRFTYVENHGGIFGIFQGNIKFFTLVSSILIIYIVLTEWKNFIKTSFINKVGIIFIIAGATGNMLDRFLRGFVIDMLDFRTIWHYIFNFADVYIHIGIYILAITYILNRKKENKTK